MNKIQTSTINTIKNIFTLLRNDKLTEIIKLHQKRVFLCIAFF